MYQTAVNQLKRMQKVISMAVRLQDAVTDAELIGILKANQYVSHLKTRKRI
jgi:hypothetical protein